MLKSLVICCLLALASVNAKDDGRIVNGQAIPISSAPHTVQLRLQGFGQYCGGTLVTPQIVVTAAHCFDKYSAENFVIVAGATTTSQPGQQRYISAIAMPQGYTSDNMQNDVAILKLDSPMNLGKDVKTVGLCSSPVNAGDSFFVAGWGSTQSGSAGSSQLLAITVPAITQDDCSNRHRNTRTRVTNVMVCAHDQSKDSCQGDSGGPAIRNGELCGIVSWGVGCASGLPGVYTNVYALRNFINNAIASL